MIAFSINTSLQSSRVSYRISEGLWRGLRSSMNSYIIRVRIKRAPQHIAYSIFWLRFLAIAFVVAAASSRELVSACKGRIGSLVVDKRRLIPEQMRLGNEQGELDHEVEKLQSKMMEIEQQMNDKDAKVKAAAAAAGEEQSQEKPSNSNSGMVGTACAQILWAVSDYYDDDVFTDIMFSLASRPEFRTDQLVSTQPNHLT